MGNEEAVVLLEAELAPFREAPHGSFVGERSGWR